MESDEEVEVIQGIVRRGFWIRMVQVTIGGDNCFSRDATRQGPGRLDTYNKDHY